MKKAYQKPVLFAENFQLVEHISEGCGLNTGTYTPNQGTAWTCSVTDAGGTTLFMEGAEKCNVEGSNALDPNLPEIDELVAALLGGVCYNTVVSGPMFSS